MKKLITLLTLITLFASSPVLASGGKKNPPEAPEPVTEPEDENTGDIIGQFLKLLEF